MLSGLARQLPAPIGGAGGEILLDFAEEYVGYLTLQVECPAATEIRICYGEFKDEALQRYSSPLDWYRDPEDHFVLKPGCHMLRSKGRRAFRYVRLIASAPATVTSVVMEAGHYPVLERGRFRCSDEILNRIWEISSRTTRLCMQRFCEAMRSGARLARAVGDAVAEQAAQERYAADSVPYPPPRGEGAGVALVHGTTGQVDRSQCGV